MFRFSLRIPLVKWFFFFGCFVFLFGGLISSAPAGADPLKKPTPLQLKKILGDFEKYAQQAQHDWQVPGMAIAIVQDNKVIFAKGFGVKKVDGNDKVDEHTIFQIGSTSKAFTATLVGMLVDEKKFSWHSPTEVNNATFTISPDDRASKPLHKLGQKRGVQKG